jgi:tripartite-type tricarboxylate transporter receptor subunit TctC
VLNSAAGVTVTHVPYRGGGRAMQDLIAGRIDYQCPLLPIATQQIQSGSVKAIALLSRERSRTMPALATAREQGLTEVDVSNWSAFFLPKGYASRDRAKAARCHGSDHERIGSAQQARRNGGRSSPS